MLHLLTTSPVRHLAIVLLGLAASGCMGTYRDVWTPPASPEGMACVAQCNALQHSCQAQQQLLAQSTYQQCQHQYTRAMEQYSQCRAQYPSGRCTQWRTATRRDANGREVSKQVCEVTAYSNPCVQPKRCEMPRDTSATCEQNHRACYTRCGGRVERVEVR